MEPLVHSNAPSEPVKSVGTRLANLQTICFRPFFASCDTRELKLDACLSIPGEARRCRVDLSSIAPGPQAPGRLDYQGSETRFFSRQTELLLFAAFRIPHFSLPTHCARFYGSVISVVPTIERVGLTPDYLVQSKSVPPPG